MDFKGLPFGGMFDLNGDGVTDPLEDYIAYRIVNGEDSDNSEDDNE